MAETPEQVIADAAHELSRSVLGLVTVRPTDTLADVVKDVIKVWEEVQEEVSEYEQHNCECDCSDYCENCGGELL